MLGDGAGVAVSVVTHGTVMMVPVVGLPHTLADGGLVSDDWVVLGKGLSVATGGF